MNVMDGFEVPNQLWIAVGKFPNGEFTYRVAETMETACRMLHEAHANAVLIDARRYVPEV